MREPQSLFRYLFSTQLLPGLVKLELSWSAQVFQHLVARFGIRVFKMKQDLEKFDGSNNFSFKDEDVYCSDSARHFGVKNSKPVTTLLAAHFKRSTVDSPQTQKKVEHIACVPYANAMGSFMVKRNDSFFERGKIGVLFSTGTAVEVSFDGQHSRDTWHLATVLRETGKNTFLVEYQNLGTGDETETTVDSHHIRPCPPRLEDKEFVLLEKVDAFYDFGWWSGNIVKILEDRRYIVLIKHTKMEKELSHAELRLHMDWIDGKWVIGSGEIEVPLSDSQEHTGMAISLITPAFLTPDLNEIEQSTPCNEKPPSHRVTSTLKKLRQEASDSDSRRALKKLSEGNAAQATLPVTPTPASARSKLSGFAAFATHATGDMGTAWSRRAMMGDQLSKRTKSPLGREVVSQISCSELWFIVNPPLASGTPVIETTQQKVGLLENKAPIVSRRKRSAKRPHARPIRKGKSQVERFVSSAKGKDGDVMGYGAEERVEREGINGEVGMSVNSLAENPKLLLGKDHKASLMFMMNQKLQLMNPVVEDNEKHAAEVKDS
ncbi:hypothetical protein RJ639_005956 [Escallonia herrerae]|uniref:Agenet domain-containing protein n=1 Tax=Escallonia herrerae TaxID=1293975 RepID=A0AA88VYQ0_9ASTE|nr:hypothetical protein RJ639_005956 [Escallonia herrerae]